MTRYFTADLHLGETRLELMGRPFTSSFQNDEEIIANLINRLTNEDELIIIGDVVSKSAVAPEQSLNDLNCIPGRKTLIRGNHDEQFTDEQLAPYFEKIIPHGDGIEMEVAGIPCWLTHYPTRGRPDRFNLCGHVHSAWKIQLNMLNVGVDANHFHVYDEDHIKFIYNAICNVYDADVWVAYREQNSLYMGKRGKQTSYFEEN